MFLHLTKQTAVQVTRGTPFTSWLHQIHVLGSNDEAQTLPDCIPQKKNSITIKGTATQMTKTKMTEVKVNYTILWNKCCKGSYS
jgi:hypothetical protein